MDSIHRIFCCRFSKNDMLLDMNNNNASIHIVDDDCFDTNGSGNERKDAKVRFAETDSAISPPLASSPSASSKSPSARSPAKSPALSPSTRSSSASSRSRSRSPSIRPSGSGKSPGRSSARSSSAPSAKSTRARSSASAASITIPGEAKDYLPKFIVNRFGDDEIPIVADSCQLKSKFHGKNGIIQHRYTVAWIEEDDGPIHREAMKLPKKTKSKNTKNGKSKVGGQGANVSRVAKSPRRKCCETADLQTKKSYPRSSVVVKRDLSSIATLKSEEPSQTSNREIGVEIGMKGGDGGDSEYRKCDGPCGEKRPVADLRILGRCDHAICSVCVIRAPMVPSEDGSMGCCNKRCFAIDLVNEIPDATRRHELYQQIFKKQKFDEIFKLYKGDILRAKFPRKDLNSQYSTSSASASPSATSVTSTATSTNASSRKSSSASSTSSLKPAMGPPALYETISSLNENGSGNESGTETSGKYDLPPSPSTTASQTSASSSSSQTPSEYSCSTVYESARASVSLENPPVIAHEIFMLRLVILESSYFSTIKRHRFDEELGAKVPLLAAVESLMGISAGRNLYNSTTRIFYCPDENMKTTESMLEMNAKEHAQLTMEELATEWGKICIIIDYTGKLVKDQRKPFKQSSVKKEK